MCQQSEVGEKLRNHQISGGGWESCNKELRSPLETDQVPALFQRNRNLIPQKLKELNSDTGSSLEFPEDSLQLSQSLVSWVTFIVPISNLQNCGLMNGCRFKVAWICNHLLQSNRKLSSKQILLYPHLPVINPLPWNKLVNCSCHESGNLCACSCFVWVVKSSWTVLSHTCYLLPFWFYTQIYLFTTIYLLWV